MVQARILTQMVAAVTNDAEPGNADSVLRAIDQFVEKSAAMFMHIGAEKGLLVDQIIAEKKPRRILELGTFFGYSAIRMARLLPISGELTTLEVNPRDAGVARSLVEYSQLDDRVVIMEGNSADSLLHLSGTFDLVFFDHYAGNYLKDLKTVESTGLLASESCLVADNVHIHEYDCSDYLQHVRGTGLYSSETHEVHCRHHGGTLDAIEVSQRL